MNNTSIRIRNVVVASFSSSSLTTTSAKATILGRQIHQRELVRNKCSFWNASPQTQTILAAGTTRTRRKPLLLVQSKSSSNSSSRQHWSNPPPPPLSALAFQTSGRYYSNSNTASQKNQDDNDPDNYRGPGGLTGRQLFEAVQKSVERDRQYQRVEEAMRGTSNSDSTTTTRTKQTKSTRRNEKNQNDTTRHGVLQEEIRRLLSKKVPLQEWSIPQLKPLLHQHQIGSKDCLEKQDLIERIQTNRLHTTEDAKS